MFQTYLIIGFFISVIIAFMYTSGDDGKKAYEESKFGALFGCFWIVFIFTLCWPIIPFLIKFDK